MSKKPTDDEIIEAVAERPNGQMTYVVCNLLSSRYRGLKTEWVRRRLERMEKSGRVRRVPSHYMTQICWALNS